jgi:hypothetical protein
MARGKLRTLSMTCTTPLAMTISGPTTAAFPLSIGTPSCVMLILTRAPEAVLYDAPDTRSGEYAAKPSITCASRKPPTCPGVRVVLPLKPARNAASLGANTVMLGAELRVEFELLRKDENLEVEAVDAKVSERVSGMVKKLSWLVSGAYLNVHTHPSVMWMIPPSYGILALRMVTLFPNPEYSSMGAELVLQRARLERLRRTACSPEKTEARSPCERTTC